MEKYGDQAVQTMTDMVPDSNATATKNYLSPHSNHHQHHQQHHHQQQQQHQQSSPYNSPSQIPTIKKTLASDAGTGSYVRKGSPREKHMEDLVHTDLSAILNTDTVDRRNRMLAEVGPITTNIVFSSLLNPSASGDTPAATNPRRAHFAATTPQTRFIPTNERGTLLLDVHSFFPSRFMLLILSLSLDFLSF